MRKLSKTTAILSFALELLLIYYYFSFLTPSYNKIGYTETPKIESDELPTCSKFITQKEAQGFFDKNKDELPTLLQLDNDHDGKVCENLP